MLRPFSFPGRWLYQRQDTARFKTEPSVFGGGGQAERKRIRLEAVSQMCVAAYCINRGLLQEMGAVPCWKTDCFLYKSDKKLADLVCITSNITCKA